MREGVSVCLRRRPAVGEAVSAACFESVAIGAARYRYRTLFLSVDPFLRCRFDASTGVDYTAPYERGGVLQSAGLAVDEQMRQVVVQAFDSWPWATHVSQAPPQTIPVPAPLGLVVSPTHLLGALGTTGLTAYCGIVTHAPVGPGDVLVVSGAAGAVGHLVGQIAKSRGASFVVGICGSDEKGRILQEHCGFDVVVNRRSSNFAPLLREALEGRRVSHYFDNAGGAVSDAVISCMDENSTVILCGQIDSYNRTSDVGYPPPLPDETANLVKERSIRRDRYLVLNYQLHFPAALAELSQLIASGKLKALETVTPGGVEAAPTAFINMMAGQNMGKALVACDSNFPLKWKIANWMRENVLPRSVKGIMARSFLSQSTWKDMM